MRTTRRRGGKVRRQFSADTVEKVKAIAEGCRSLSELARRAQKELGISYHDLLAIEQDGDVRFPRASPKTRHPEVRPEFIHPRNPTYPGFGRTSPT